MTKQDFLSELRKGLTGLPENDREERLAFYGEMIDDRLEEGFSEEDAVKDLGTVDTVIAQIIAETPLTKLVKEKVAPKNKPKAWEIVLLALGFPLWFPLLTVAVVVFLTVYVVVWSVIIAFWSVFVSLVACGLACIFGGVYFALGENVLVGIAVIGAGLVCGGLSVFMFYGCRVMTKLLLIVTKKWILWVKNRLARKEKAL